MTRITLAFAAGLVVPLGFAPWSWWLVSIVGLAGFWCTLRDATPWQGAVRGYAFGLGMFGCGVSWVQVSIHQFGIPSYWFSVPMTMLFVMFLACYPALFGFLSKRITTSHASLWWLVCCPALWSLTELLRGWLFGGFGWLAIGYAQSEGLLSGMIPVFGVSGAGILSASLAGVIGMVLAQETTRWLRLGAIVGACLTVGGLTLLNEFKWTQPSGDALSVALIQGAIPQELKWRRDLRSQSIEHYESLSEPHWRSDILVWPETAIPAYPNEVPTVIERLEKRAQQNGTAFLVGIPTGEPGKRYFNSLIALGNVAGQYDKRHLVPFGEFFPAASILGGLYQALSIPMSSFSSGASDQHSVEVAGHQAGVSICYEDVFSGELRDALPAAAFLINLSNDAWFGDSLAPHQHLQIARARALETGRYLLRATNTGITAVIGPRGEIIASSPQFEATVTTAEIYPHSGSTPYVVWGDWPVVLWSAGIPLLLLARARHR